MLRSSDRPPARDRDVRAAVEHARHPARPPARVSRPYRAADGAAARLVDRRAPELAALPCRRCCCSRSSRTRSSTASSLRSAAAVVDVSAKREGTTLVLAWWTPASALRPTRKSDSGGIGLANLRARLAAMFGSAARVAHQRQCARGYARDDHDSVAMSEGASAAIIADDEPRLAEYLPAPRGAWPDLVIAGDRVQRSGSAGADRRRGAGHRLSRHPDARPHRDSTSREARTATCTSCSSRRSISTRSRRSSARRSITC